MRQKASNFSDENDSIEDLEFQKLKEKARNEINHTFSRLLYRTRYNLPPNDPRFLDMTDEDIIYELILSNEFADFLKNRERYSSNEETEIFESDKKQFDSITKRLDEGEDIDLNSLRPKSSWEKV